MASGFVWYDLLTRDVAAAATFYRDVVGWGWRPDDGPGGYSFFTVGDRPVAGLMTSPPERDAHGAPPAWIGYVGVDDADAAVADLTARSGKLLRPVTPIEGVGRFAIVADPEGAVFSLFEVADSSIASAAAPGNPGHVGWHELLTTDVEGAFAFYGALFGWTHARSHDMGPMGTYEIFAIDGVERGGIMRRPPAASANFWGYYIQVPKVADAIPRITEGGGSIVNGPIDVPGGTVIVQAVDPQGAFFALSSAGD